MKVFLDEGVPRKLVPFLSGHDVHTVVSRGWGGMKNGALLALLGREGFDVFLTGDKNMPYQQPLTGRPFAVLILSAINWPVIRPHVDKIAAAIAAAEPGTVTLIECGVVLPRSKSGSD